MSQSLLTWLTGMPFLSCLMRRKITLHFFVICQYNRDSSGIPVLSCLQMKHYNWFAVVGRYLFQVIEHLFDNAYLPFTVSFDSKFDCTVLINTESNSSLFLLRQYFLDNIFCNILVLFWLRYWSLQGAHDSPITLTQVTAINFYYRTTNWNILSVKKKKRY